MAPDPGWPDPPGWPGADDVPRVLDLMDRPGCVLCRTRAEAAGIWTRWFVIENHGVPATLLALEQSAGFCPAHTRRVLAEGGPEVLRMPWEFTVRGAIGRAGRLAAGDDPGRGRRDQPRSPCPLCRVIAQREQATRDDLAGSLDDPHVGPRTGRPPGPAPVRPASARCLVGRRRHRNWIPGHWPTRRGRPRPGRGAGRRRGRPARHP